MTLIDGKAISEQVKQEIAAEVAEIVAQGGKRPHLAAILVGHDGGSETYVAAKVKACEVCGFKSSLIRYESDVTEEELLAKVRELNEDSDVDGFIVQLPLPKHISEQKVIETIDYRKDVDGFHPINVGRMSIGLPCYVSATPNGILELLKRYEIETSGKKCVVLGRSNIVGKPMASLMMQKAYPGDATVTVCHSRSKDLVKECQEADIIIAALGQPNFVKEEMVKEGFAGVCCVEAGGPSPGLGCAGRGIIAALETLEKKGAYEKYRPDVVIYDVLGDVVCGGFAAPIREGYASKVLIVTSGEKMALYAANNINNAVKNFEDRSYAKVYGIVLNHRNVENETEKVTEFADSVGLPIVGEVPRSDEITRCEDRGMTVVEGEPESPAAQAFLNLAKELLENAQDTAEEDVW